MEIARYEIIDDVTTKKLKECKKILKKHEKKCRSVTLESYFSDCDLVGITKKTRDVISLVADVVGDTTNPEIELAIIMGKDLEDSATKIILKVHDEIVKLAWEPEQ